MTDGTSSIVEMLFICVSLNNKSLVDTTVHAEEMGLFIELHARMFSKPVYG